jgi:hypothetical protein
MLRDYQDPLMMSRPRLDIYAKITETVKEECRQRGMDKNKLPLEVLEYFKQQGSVGGKLGGSKGWEKLTPEERTARAKNAVAAREAKRAATKKTTEHSDKASAKKAAAKSAEVRTKKAAAKKTAAKTNARKSTQ